MGEYALIANTYGNISYTDQQVITESFVVFNKLKLSL